tara:strand:+ start:105 stop:2279 length:2175 start_codon:yes stop_codon:yes gene_type:complete
MSKASPANEAAAVYVDPSTLTPWESNPRDNAEAIEQVARSIERFGFASPIIARQADGRIIAGHTRHAAALRLGLKDVPVRFLDLDEQTASALALADNRLGEIATWDDEGLAAILEGLAAEDVDLDGLGWDEDELESLLDSFAGSSDNPSAPIPGSMAATFGAPPVTLLDSRQGYWQDRKRLWIEKGIVSEQGRGHLAVTCNAAEGKYDYMSGRGGSTGGSIFDPVLAELMVRWFSPESGRVLDPFAGGSVRGVVSAMVGRHYTGIDLRREQVEANREQWGAIRSGLVFASVGEVTIKDPDAITPIQQVGDLWIKRDDLFECNGVRGGKVRTCLALSQGSAGLITAGSRSSPQVNIVAHVAEYLGLPCRVHTPEGEPSPEVAHAISSGAERVTHRPGYNSVIIKRARDDAKERGWTEIPFGMECHEAVKQTRRQVPEVLAEGVSRLVVPVGSGMSLSGILWGLQDHGHGLNVLGVVVGADPSERLDKYAPPGWRDMVVLVEATEDYHEEVNASVGDLKLDPVYEAKCVPHLRHGDMLWVVGVRATLEEFSVEGSTEWIEGDSAETLGRGVQDEFDLVLSCPPYGDLEVYSDNPNDLSTMSHDQFLASYRSIIEASVERMAPDSFAVWVVGDYRDGRGLYRNFVGDTISAFLGAGVSLYNEAIYLSPMGTLPLRAGKSFRATRKLGKTHQNVLVFVKGDPRKAAEKCGTIDLRLKEDEETQDGQTD